MYENLNEHIPDLDRYLERLQVPRSDRLDKEYLDRLIFAHQCRIPFENLDIYDYHRQISLGISDLYRKVIENHRGGYCFELNGLFTQFLRDLGYRATSCICRIVRKKDFLPPTRNRGIIGEIDSKYYFCDVGFGGPMPPAALLIEDGAKAELGRETYYIRRADDFWWTMGRITSSGERENVIQFYTMPQDNVNFLTMNYYCSNSPDSAFLQRRSVNIRTEAGSNSITDRIFTRTVNGETYSKEIESREEMASIMQEYFHIPARI